MNEISIELLYEKKKSFYNLNNECPILDKYHSYIDIIFENNKEEIEIDIDINKINDLKCFYSCRIPDISIHDFINRLLIFIVSEDVNINGLLIHSVIILNRVLARGIKLNEYNIHRLLAICLLISTKIYDDLNYNNEYLSIISGLQLFDFNNMEIELLQYIDYDVFISKENMLSILKTIPYLF
jgi:hypothetical protein